MRFELSKKEVNTLNEFVKSTIEKYGEPDELKRTYSFTPTGLGFNIKVRLKSELFDLTEDITDYDSW